VHLAPCELASENLGPDSERNDGWIPPLGKGFEIYVIINAKAASKNAEANDNLAAAMESR